VHPAAAFVIAMFGPHPDGRVYVAALPNPDNKGAEPDERHIVSRNSAQITDFVIRQDQPGQGCFTCVATIQDKATRRAEKTVAQIVCLHAEIDFRQTLEAPEEVEHIVADLPLLPSRVHHSGHGLHLYWFLKTAVAATRESIARHKRLLRRLADYLGGDPAACLVHQLLRLPGTINSKNGERHEVRVLADHPDLRYELADLENWIATAGPPLIRCKTAAGNGSSPDNPFLAFAAAHASEAPLDVDQLLADMVYLGPGGGGNAHDTLLRCTAAMLTRGEDREAVVARALTALQAAAERAGIALDLERERRTIEEMCQSWMNKHPEIGERESDEPASLLPFINFSAWDSEPVPPMQWAVPDRYPIGHASLCSGDGGTGKSRTKLHLCVAHALARDWLSVQPTPGPALFIDAEDDEQELHRRLAQILHHYGASFADAWSGGLHLVSLVGRETVLGAPARNGRLESTKLYHELLQRMGDIKPKMTVIASSADVYAGSEIVREQVRQFVHLLSRLAIVAHGGLVLIAHPSLTGINSGSGLSGSTQWHNAVRARSYLQHLKPAKDELPDPDLRLFEFKKNNYGPISESIYLRYQNGLFLPAGGVHGLDARGRTALADEVFLRLLARFNQQGQIVGPNRSPNYAPARFAAHPDAQDLSSGDFAKAMQRLLDAGKIRVEEERRDRKSRSRLVVVTEEERRDAT
jgi:RecA-family ATPase